MVYLFIFLIFLLLPAIPSLIILWGRPYRAKWELKYIGIIALVTWSCPIYLSFRVVHSPIADFIYTLSFISILIHILGLFVKLGIELFQKKEKRKIKISLLLKTLLLSILLFVSLFYWGSDLSYRSKDLEFKQYQNVYNQKVDQLLSDSSTSGFNGHASTKLPTNTPTTDCFFLRDANQMKYIAFQTSSNRYFLYLGYVYIPIEDESTLTEFKKTVIGLVRLEPHWYRYTFFD